MRYLLMAVMLLGLSPGCAADRPTESIEGEQINLNTGGEADEVPNVAAEPLRQAPVVSIADQGVRFDAPAASTVEWRDPKTQPLTPAARDWLESMHRITNKHLGPRAYECAPCEGDVCGELQVGEPCEQAVLDAPWEDCTIGDGERLECDDGGGGVSPRSNPGPRITAVKPGKSDRDKYRPRVADLGLDEPPRF